MKIAVINQSSSTGGWRYLYNLVLGIKRFDESVDITIFLPSTNASMTFDLEKLKSHGIKIENFSSYGVLKKSFREKNRFKNKFLNKFSNKIRKIVFDFKMNNSIKKNLKQDDFDLFFYSWPYGIECVNTNKPIFFIPHDFIYTHSFGFDGVGIYDKGMWKANLFCHEKFVDNNAIPIVSSHYIEDEFNKTFPNAKNKPNIVYLSALNDYEEKSKKEIEEFLKNKNLNNDYVLFASNNMPHKNLGNLLGAWYYVKQKYPNLKLIISGYGNNDIMLNINSSYYADHTYNEDCDVRSFGLLKDDEFSMLMQGAKIVINPSFCEAGNGSGLDAWQLGVPVAMSEIEPFKNQIDYLGVKAELFDPRNSKDIARAIIHLLDNPSIMEENVKISKEAMDKYTWNEVAKQYLENFRNKER